MECSWRSMERRSQGRIFSMKAVCPMHHIHRVLFYIRTSEAWPNQLTMRPLSTHPPPSLGHVPHPSQSRARRRCSVSVTAPPGPARRTENQPAACFPPGSTLFCYGCCRGSLPVSQGLQRHSGRWGEMAERREQMQVEVGPWLVSECLPR